MKHLILTLILSLFVLSGCGSSSSDSTSTTENITAKANTPKSIETATEKTQTMLFFLNPNGAPCKRQKAILTNMQDQLKTKHVEIEYVSTKEMASSEPIFRQYGIRALPTIIILDEKGVEKKRFPPGVQSQEALLAAID